MGLTALQLSYLACPSMALRPLILNQRLLALLLALGFAGGALAQAKPVLVGAVLSQTDMPKCRQLWLSKNHLTDEGMKIIEQCLRGGALPSLESVHVYGMPNASFKSRDEIRNAREDLKVCYDGMGGGRDNHIQ